MGFKANSPLSLFSAGAVASKLVVAFSELLEVATGLLILKCTRNMLSCDLPPT